MLLRHTVSALALAATVGLNSTPARSVAMGTGVPTMPAPSEEVGGGPGTTCLACVAGGVITLASLGWTSIYWMFMIGGAEAVAAGTAVATCTAACATYLSQE